MTALETYKILKDKSEKKDLEFIIELSKVFNEFDIDNQKMLDYLLEIDENIIKEQLE
jgi:hypothetical protein